MRQKPDSCDECGKRDKLKICSGCEQAWYCSRGCQVAAWKSHKGGCTRLKQQQQSGAAAGLSTSTSNRSSTAEGAAAEAAREPEGTAASQTKAAAAAASASANNTTAAPAGSSSSSNDRDAPSKPSCSTSSKAASAKPSSSSSSASGKHKQRQKKGSSTSTSTTSSSAGTADDDSEFVLPFRYRTKADPTAKDIESPLYFTSKELEHLSEVYPGLLYDGDSCSVNLDRYLMKKVKTWYVQYLLRKQRTPPPGSNEDQIPFFQGLMSGDIAITQAKFSEEMGLGTTPCRDCGVDFGVAGCISMMLDHGPKGIVKHPKGVPKIWIYEPDEYSNIRLNK